MKVIDPGHTYELNWLDGTALSQPILKDNVLMFVKRVGEKYPGNVQPHPGTTMQEVLRALIDRVKYVDGQVPSDYNGDVVHHLRQALINLEYRAAERHDRLSDFMSRFGEADCPELLPYCSKCGHIGCEGACHP